MSDDNDSWKELEKKIGKLLRGEDPNPASTVLYDAAAAAIRRRFANDTKTILTPETRFAGERFSWEQGAKPIYK